MSKRNGLPSGLSELDKKIEGFHSGNLYIVGGRPEAGKTAFALSIIHFLIQNNIPVGLLSLKMNSAEIALKLLGMESKVDTRLASTANLDKMSWKNIQSGINQLSDRPLYIDDLVEITIQDLKDKTKQLKSNHKIAMLIIDYLQLIRGVKGISNRKNTKNICGALKEIALIHDIPVLVTAQLSRRPERRQDRRPELNDFLYANEIEESADTIMLLHRSFMDNLAEEEKDCTEIIIVKTRCGSTGRIRPVLSFR